MTDEHALLRWIHNLLSDYGELERTLGPHAISTDTIKQEQTYVCGGCKAQYISCWPNWTVDFKHDPGCMYVAFLEVVN